MNDPAATEPAPRKQARSSHDPGRPRRVFGWSGRGVQIGFALLLLTGFLGALFIGSRRGQTASPVPDPELQDRARRLLAATRSQLQHQQVMIPKRDLAAAADSLAQYFKGVVDTLAFAPPGFFSAVTAALERTTCGGPSDADLLIYSRLGQLRPGLITPAGLRCALAAHPREDRVLWSVLDAWRATRTPKTEELRRLEATSLHDQTRRRLLPDGGRSRPRPRLAPTIAPSVPAAPATLDQGERT
jgi:hypothetical protein